MGNESCSFPKLTSTDFQVPDLKNRSTYGQHTGLPDQDILRAIFNQSHKDNRKSMVAKKIADHSQQLFEDQKFKIDSKESSRLSVLFDFERMNTRIYMKKGEMDVTSFIQLNIQLCYLTCVFYLLCRKDAKASLMKQIIQTQETNKYGAYSLNFFCNGERHSVIIDDKMPTHADSFVYLRIVKGIQLWPLILEKAWCKQIGSYEKAKGLSPEDAFEEITGIPAYSHRFRADNRTMIKNMLATANRENYWVSLVARNGLEDLKNRQVFYLQDIDKDDNYTIISPYSSFQFEDYQQQRRGEVKVKEEDIFTHFQYAVIGFYKENYVNTWLGVDCKSREEMLFSLTIHRKEEVAIRFNQFYEGYLSEEERLNYQYSPILIQLYEVDENAGVKGKHNLVYHCQGCNRSLSGARSANCAKNILQTLEGKYIIRLEVEWQHQSLLHKGNLVVYSSEGNATLQHIKNNGQMLNEIYKEFFQGDYPKQKISILNQHSLEIKTFDKLNTTVISFRNLVNSTQTFQIDFKNSKNLMIRGGKVNNQKTTIKLQGQEITVIQVLPRSIRDGMVLQNFSITKLDRRQ